MTSSTILLITSTADQEVAYALILLPEWAAGINSPKASKSGRKGIDGLLPK
jgi:hypothetical protein